MKEFIVRIKALAGRVNMKQEKDNSVYNIGDYLFDADRAMLTYTPTDEIEQLPNREAEVLTRFC